MDFLEEVHPGSFFSFNLIDFSQNHKKFFLERGVIPEFVPKRQLLGVIIFPERGFLV